MLEGEDFKNAFINLANKNEYSDDELKTIAIISSFSMLRTFNKMSKRLIFVSVYSSIKEALRTNLTEFYHLLDFEFGVKIFYEVVKTQKMYFFTLGNSLIGPGRSDILKGEAVIFFENFYPDHLRGQACKGLLH